MRLDVKEKKKKENKKKRNKKTTVDGDGSIRSQTLLVEKIGKHKTINSIKLLK